MKNENLPIETDKEFKNQTVQTKEEIENDDKKNYSNIFRSLAFYKDDLKAAK